MLHNNQETKQNENNDNNQQQNYMRKKKAKKEFRSFIRMECYHTQKKNVHQTTST